MIVIQLQGGTGNQMFQYAFGYKLTKELNTELKLDITRYANSKILKSYSNEERNDNSIISSRSIKKLKAFDQLRELKRWYFSPIHTKYYGTETIRTYRLFNFSITGSPLNSSDLLKIKLIHKLRLIESPEIDAYRFIPEILNTENNSYLIGFWQSHKYFEDIAEEIRNEFTVKVPPNDKNKSLLEKIKNTNSICIHVRRGDYLKPAHSEHHGVCSKEYYERAIELIKEKVSNPHFFIFSDEPDWAKENIKTNSPMFISYNSLDEEYEDIRLMYNCKHFIIANSSFSWWGAWLSRNEEKIVCAPKVWVANEKFDTKDALPTEWVRI